MKNETTKTPTVVPRHLVVPILVTALNVVVLIGLARWSWTVADEQARLRRDFADLKNSQTQLDAQFEFWLARLRDRTEKP